jgi:Tol biopolymer transport system component
VTTGRRAFDAPTRGALITSILESDPPPVHTIQPSAPPALERVIAKCLAKDPEKRWQSARDLADELEWIATGQASNDRHVTAPAPARPRTRVPRVLAGAGLLTVAALAVTPLAVRPRPAAIVEHPVRFSITPAEGSRFLQGAAFLAMSPDGRHLAYIASVPDGTQRLWVRALDSLDARALAGTDRANQPFWSPDGRFLAYTQDGKLKKIDISGGPPQTVADVAGQGGTWNRDDVIVFPPDIRRGLYRVSAGGGPVVPVVPIDRQRGEIAIAWPTFLPDGRHFLYRVLSERDEHTGVFLGSLDSSERRRVMSVDSNTAYVEPGYLLYHKEGALTAQRFDTDRFLPVGDPIVLARQLTYSRLNGRGSFSASASGVLAYRQTNQAQLAWFDRHGRMLSSIGEPAFYLELSLSPDGTRVASTRLDPRTNTSDVLLVDTERSVTSQVTFAPSSEQTPLWSPDGREIIFSADPDGFFNLFRKPATAEGRDESLFRSASHKRPLDWSRDGRTLIFEQSLTTDGAEGLWTLPLGGARTPARIPIPTQRNGSSAQLSPDGRWLAWVSRESGDDEIYLQSFPIAGTRRKISSNGGTEPRWRRDMTELFYLAPTGDLMAAPLARSATLDIGAAKALFRTPFGQLTNITGRNRYDVAPDGERFLMTVPSGGSESAPITVVLNWAAALAR